MTTTDTTTEQEKRAAAIAGLRKLAAFLTSHPDIPLPQVGVHAGYRNIAGLVSWIDGLDELRIEKGLIPSMRRVVRTFAGLDVPMHVDDEMVGETRQVPTVAAEFTPFTVDEIRDRAVATQNGDL